MEIRKSRPSSRLFLSFLVVVALNCLSLPAVASSNGITGFSGKSGSTCTSCHSTGAVPTVTLSGPTTVASGSTNSYTLTVSGTGNGGLDVAASIGTFTAGTGTKVQNSEITHTSPSSSHSWTFSWTAPSVTANMVATMFGAAINSFGGGTGAIQQAITITAPAPAAALSVSPASLSFNFQQGSANPTAQSLAVTSSGSALTYTVATSTTSGGSWLSASSGSGSTPGSASISVNPAGLAPGTYSGSVTISSSSASNSPRTVPVTLNVTAAPLPSITASPASLSFAFQIGGTTPAAQSVSVSSSGAAASYTVAASTTSGGSWLSASAGSGMTPGSVSVSVNPSGLAAGTYSGSVTVSSSGASNSPRTVSVTLNVTAAALPAITASPASLSFAFQTGGVAPMAQTISVTSSGAVATYAAAAATTSGGSWLSANAGGGATPGSVSVSVNPSGLAAGTYNGSVSILSSDASNSPRTVAVSLTVTAAQLPSLNASPASLSFNYETGGTVPASQSVAVSSSGAGLSFTASASGGAWLSAAPSSGSTPGNVAVSVNPSGLTAGTYSGMVTISAAGSTNSPRNVAVSLIVTSAPSSTSPTLNVSPGTLSFSYQAGAAASGSQNLNISGSAGSLSYAATTSGGTWLSASPASGSTPGTVKVSVNATGLAAGSYKGAVNLTSTDASNSPQSVPVTLTVTAAGSGRLRAMPGFVWFFYQTGHSDPLTKSVRVTSTGAPLSFTADAFGGGWLSVSPTGGTTTGTLSISINPSGLASGKYSGLIKIAAAGAAPLNVPVVLRVAGGEDDGEGGEGGGETEGQHHHAQPILEDRAESGSVAAAWVDGAGVPADDPADPRKQGLLLTKNSTTSTHARAGVALRDVEGLALTQLGFDIRSGSHCSAHAPAFIVVTSDDVGHLVGGCSKATSQPAPAAGWKRLRFDPANPAQASPAISPGSRVKSIYLLLDEGPDAGTGLAVLDNINVNGHLTGKE